jgi:hypothetical protein
MDWARIRPSSHRGRTQSGSSGPGPVVRPTTRSSCKDFRLWPDAEVPIAVKRVRLSGQSGRHLLGLSFTESGPQLTSNNRPSRKIGYFHELLQFELSI